MATRKAQPASRLPQGFEMLDCWIDDWVLADSTARHEKRLNTPLAATRAFYDAMLPHAEAVLAHLATRRLGELEAQDERLLKLMLSLAEIGPAIEWYGTGNYPDAFDARRFPLIVTLSDTAAQSQPA